MSSQLGVFLRLRLSDHDATAVHALQGESVHIRILSAGLGFVGQHLSSLQHAIVVCREQTLNVTGLKSYMNTNTPEGYMQTSKIIYLFIHH